MVRVPLVHLLSIALYTGPGTGYSVMKLPCVRCTLRVTPRLMVCRRLHPDSIPPVDEAIEAGRSYSPKEFGSIGLWACQHSMHWADCDMRLTLVGTCRLRLTAPSQPRHLHSPRFRGTPQARIWCLRTHLVVPVLEM